ncbi:MAG: hypothetical protein AB1405_05720 [Bdellovibrionota bacterium]
MNRTGAVLLFLAGVLAAGNSPASEPAKPTPQAFLLALDCRSLDPKPANADADCHTGAIAFKKAFFDAPFPLRLRSLRTEGEDADAALETRFVLYRKAKVIPGQPEGAYEWTYHALLFWFLQDIATRKNFAAGWFEGDSGRRFVGSPGRGFDPGLLRTPSLKGTAAQLPERTARTLRGLGVLDRKPPPGPFPNATVEGPKTLAGACKTAIPDEGAKGLLRETARSLIEALAASPELAAPPAPWTGKIETCPGGKPRLNLEVHSKGISAKASCALAPPLSLSEPPGIIAQCAVAWGDSLRASLLTQFNQPGAK